MFQAGDIIEPLEGRTPLPHGPYKVIHIGPDISHLSRLPAEEETEILLNANRMTYVPSALLKCFQLAPPGGTNHKSEVKPPSLQSNLLSGKRIVIVEEDTLLQVQFRRNLVTAGLRVVGQATTGEEGLVMILDEKPDLVLLDIALPGMDGLEVARRVLPELASVVIVMTAYDVRKYGEQPFDAGACGVISKPISSDLLIAELERCCPERTQKSGCCEANGVCVAGPDVIHYDYETLQEDVFLPAILSVKQAEGWKIIYTYIKTDRATRRRKECYLLQRLRPLP